MKKLIVLVMLLVNTQVYAENSKIEVRGTVDDGEDIILSTGLITKYFASGAIQTSILSLDSNSAFTAATIPLGAKAVLIDVMSSDGIALKGVSADVGISLDDTCPILLPLTGDSTTLTFGFQNRESNSNRVRLFFF